MLLIRFWLASSKNPVHLLTHALQIRIRYYPGDHHSSDSDSKPLLLERTDQNCCLAQRSHDDLDIHHRSKTPNDSFYRSLTSTLKPSSHTLRRCQTTQFPCPRNHSGSRVARVVLRYSEYSKTYHTAYETFCGNQTPVLTPLCKRGQQRKRSNEKSERKKTTKGGERGGRWARSGEALRNCTNC